MDFTGSYTAIVTPFTVDGVSLDLTRLEEQINFQAEGGITGVVPCGTTGESPTLTDTEQRALIHQTIEIARSLGLKIIAGAGSNNTSHAVEMHKYVAQAGADASLQVNPYYNKPSQEGLYRHFSTIADSADIPVMLYNVPARSGVAISPETAARLAQHPNIQAIKEATGSLDSASEIINNCGDNLQLLSGDDSMTLPFAAIGGVGVVSVVSNIMPDKTAALCNAFNNDEWDEARRLHYDLFAVSKALLALDTNPIPIKTAMKILNRDTGVLRLPMCESSTEAHAIIEKLLKMAGLTQTSALTV